MNDQQLIDAYDNVVADEPARIRFLELLDQADADKHAFLRRPQALAESARWYAEQGIAVFPLQPRSKIPCAVHEDAKTQPPTLTRSHRGGHKCRMRTLV